MTSFDSFYTELISDQRLKPCPFCGSEAEIKRNGPKGLIIRCIKCHIGLNQKVLRYSLEWLAETLINNWNKRV